MADASSSFFETCVKPDISWLACRCPKSGRCRGGSEILVQDSKLLPQGGRGVPQRQTPLHARWDCRGRITKDLGAARVLVSAHVQPQHTALSPGPTARSPLCHPRKPGKDHRGREEGISWSGGSWLCHLCNPEEDQAGGLPCRCCSTARTGAAGEYRPRMRRPWAQPPGSACRRPPAAAGVLAGPPGRRWARSVACVPPILCSQRHK